MKISWINFLDPFAFTGGGEQMDRELHNEGARRGHQIVNAGFLRARPQRALRRAGMLRGLRVDWDADAFILSNLRNAPAFPRRIPQQIIDRALGSGRAAIFEHAWVDVCLLDLPCLGDRAHCADSCEKTCANHLYSAARAAIFASPLQRDAYGAIIDVPLPEHQIFCRPFVDVERFHPMGLERDIDVLYVGTIKESKGYHELLERFGPERMTFAGINALDGPVAGKWLGRVSDAELPVIYNRARTFAHLPRWLEPMGKTPVEAAMCGCEIVLNERVGLTSYPREEWTDPEIVRRAPTRFWEDFEAVFGP